MDKAAVEAALRAAELTDTELDQYKQRAAAALAKMQGKSGGAAQSDAETVSAHSALAIRGGWAGVPVGQGQSGVREAPVVPSGATGTCCEPEDSGAARLPPRCPGPALSASPLGSSGSSADG